MRESVTYVVHENNGEVGSIGGHLVPRDSVLTVVEEAGSVRRCGNTVGEGGGSKGEDGREGTHCYEKLQRWWKVKVGFG